MQRPLVVIFLHWFKIVVWFKLNPTHCTGEYLKEPSVKGGVLGRQVRKGPYVLMYIRFGGFIICYIATWFWFKVQGWNQVIPCVYNRQRVPPPQWQWINLQWFLKGTEKHNSDYFNISSLCCVDRSTDYFYLLNPCEIVQYVMIPKAIELGKWAIHWNNLRMEECTWLLYVSLR